MTPNEMIKVFKELVDEFGPEVLNTNCFFWNEIIEEYEYIADITYEKAQNFIVFGTGSLGLD